MTALQKMIKCLATAFAIFLSISILLGITSMIGLFGGIFNGDATFEDVKTYSVSSDIQTLKVMINAADFSLKLGDSFSVESNLKHIAVEDQSGVLTIKETKKFNNTDSGAVLTLYVPADTVFEKVDFICGAGRVNIDCLSASKIDFELGAGKVTIGTLIATSNIRIEGGAGEINISGGALHNLDFDMGVGQFNLTSALTGDSKFDLGIGETNITVIGNRDDYKLDVEKGLGNIAIDGINVSNITGQGNGNDRIKISGGVGGIYLNFKG